jgi:hemerythrin-like domain-containing protein
MKQETTPLKRSKQLAPLSREHHDGLLFSWKIKQGIENKVSLEVMRKFTLWFWKHHIRPHFFQEEKILMPYMPFDHPLGKRLKEEHDHIRELIIELDEEADKRHLLLLCDLLDQHIRFEERELFGFLEELLTSEQLDNVFSELEAHPLGNEEWTDEFWVKK